MTLSGNYSQVSLSGPNFEKKEVTRDEALKTSQEKIIRTGHLDIFHNGSSSFKSEAIIVENDDQFPRDLLKKISDISPQFLVRSDLNSTAFKSVNELPNIFIPINEEALPLDPKGFYFKTIPFAGSLLLRQVDPKKAIAQAVNAFKNDLSLIGYQFPRGTRLVFDLTQPGREPLALDLPANEAEFFQSQLNSILNVSIEVEANSTGEEDDSPLELTYFDIAFFKNQVPSQSCQRTNSPLSSISEEDEGLPPHLLENYSLSENNSVFQSKENSSSSSKKTTRPSSRNK